MCCRRLRRRCTSFATSAAHSAGWPAGFPLRTARRHHPPATHPYADKDPARRSKHTAASVEVNREISTLKAEMAHLSNEVKAAGRCRVPFKVHRGRAAFAESAPTRPRPAHASPILGSGRRACACGSRALTAAGARSCAFDALRSEGVMRPCARAHALAGREGIWHAGVATKGNPGHIVGELRRFHGWRRHPWAPAAPRPPTTPRHPATLWAVVIPWVAAPHGLRPLHRLRRCHGPRCPQGLRRPNMERVVPRGVGDVMGLGGPWDPVA